MNVLIDTCVWSLALRRRKKSRAEVRLVKQFKELIREMRVVLVGPVRQEVLSGIREEAQFVRVRDRLRAFVDLPLESPDFELAADMFNRCRARGVQGSNTDFLLCALAERHRLVIFTTDKDFGHYNEILGTTIFKPTPA